MIKQNMQTIRSAVFPGSFDPVTKGHLAIAEKALGVFDRIIVLVGENISKKYLFSTEKRLFWLKEVFSQYKDVEIDTYNGLTVDYCKNNNIRYIIRGLRNESDFLGERNIALVNKELDKDIETVFFLTDNENSLISSSAVREILTFNGDITKFIPSQIHISKEDILR